MTLSRRDCRMDLARGLQIIPLTAPPGRRVGGGVSGSGPTMLGSSTRPAASIPGLHHYALVMRWLEDTPPEAARAQAARGGAAVPPHRHHLLGLYRGRRSRAAHPLRHHPARHRRRRMGGPAARPDAARAGAERLHRRRLSRARDPARRPDARGAGAAERGLPAGDAGLHAGRTASIPMSPASTWCASGRTNSMCSRTIAARRRASPTCSRTARR